MVLFSIAEPGQGRAQQVIRRKRAVGIDLGTTNSLVAVAKEDKVEVIADEREPHGGSLCHHPVDLTGIVFAFAAISAGFFTVTCSTPFSNRASTALASGSKLSGIVRWKDPKFRSR